MQNGLKFKFCVSRFNKENSMPSIEKYLNYQFKDPYLLKNALAHKSFVNENSNISNNERLEFLGDAVLQLAITDILMAKFPKDAEGDLSKKRAYLVGEPCLASIAKRLRVQEFLSLGKGEMLTEGHEKPRLLASALEAIIGAIYRDSNLDVSKKFIKNIFSQELENMSDQFAQTDFVDFKTQLQEQVWQIYQCVPKYLLTKSEGPDHNRLFYMDVLIDEKAIASGFGKSKKEAQQMAAQKALQIISQHPY